MSFFFNVLSLILCLAQETLYKAGQAVEPCPLTSQQVQLMLRQCMLPFFSNDMAQDLRLQNDAWMQFLPFVVGPNGVSQGNIGTGMLLPQFFAENIRCCKRITAALKNNYKGNNNMAPPGANNNMVIDIIPILGRPPKNTISQMGNFTYQQAAPVLLYAEDLLEVPINLIDASAVIGQNTAYLDLNGKTQQLLVESWNRWITGLSGVLTRLVQLSAQKGCDALSTLIYTTQERYILPEAQAPAPPVVGLNRTSSISSTTSTVHANSPTSENSKISRRASKKFIGSSMERFRVRATIAPVPGPSAIFQHVATVGTSSTLGFTSELWKYLATWVLPTAFTITPNTESSLMAYMTNVIEPIYQPSSSQFSSFGVDDNQNVFPIAYDKHMQFATQNVRAWNSPVKSEMEEEFELLTAQNHGGFFTKIAGAIGEALGIHGSGQFADSIGELTGL